MCEGGHQKRYKMMKRASDLGPEVHALILPAFFPCHSMLPFCCTESNLKIPTPSQCIYRLYKKRSSSVAVDGKPPDHNLPYLVLFESSSNATLLHRLIENRRRRHVDVNKHQTLQDV